MESLVEQRIEMPFGLVPDKGVFTILRFKAKIDEFDQATD
jgi:hypothetical protein